MIIMSKKKFQKKHHFVHQDPERETLEVKENELKSQASPKKDTGGYTTKNIGSDLKRTVITIGVFIILLVVLYIIQTKTGLLNPILRKFGL